MRKPLRIALALAFAAATAATTAACGGAKAKPESPLVEEGPAVPDDCCCKSVSLTAEDSSPTYEKANRMECSSKQGTCVDDVQCQGSAAE